ncbi:MAG: AAA family ATPase, partial [Azonexus sp.]
MKSSAELLQLASENLLKHFADYCEGAIIVDQEARIVWRNDRYPARLGLTLSSCVQGQPVESVIPNSLMR